MRCESSAKERDVNNCGNAALRADALLRVFQTEVVKRDDNTRCLFSLALFFFLRHRLASREDSFPFKLLFLPHILSLVLLSKARTVSLLTNCFPLLSLFICKPLFFKNAHSYPHTNIISHMHPRKQKKKNNVFFTDEKRNTPPFKHRFLVFHYLLIHYLLVSLSQAPVCNV